MAVYHRETPVSVAKLYVLTALMDSSRMSRYPNKKARTNEHKFGPVSCSVLLFFRRHHLGRCELYSVLAGDEENRMFFWSTCMLWKGQAKV